MYTVATRVEQARLECRDGCNIAVLRCQPGYSCAEGSMSRCGPGTYRNTSYDAISSCVEVSGESSWVFESGLRSRLCWRGGSVNVQYSYGFLRCRKLLAITDYYLACGGIPTTGPIIVIKGLNMPNKRQLSECYIYCYETLFRTRDIPQQGDSRF